jgi:hypothetical protein
MSLPISSAPDVFASRTVQMDCLKQSTNNNDSWSTRVLTLDRQTNTLTVSRHRHPSDVFYHSLRPSAVQTWPHFSLETINDDFYSTEAKLTLCILGNVAAVPNFAVNEVALVGVTLPNITEVVAGLPGTSYPPPEYHPAYAAGDATRVGTTTAAATGGIRRVRREKPGKFDAWVVRFQSKLAYDVALQMLIQMPDVTFSTKQNLPGFGANSRPMSFSAGRLGPLAMMIDSSKKHSKKHFT